MPSQPNNQIMAGLKALIDAEVSVAKYYDAVDSDAAFPYIRIASIETTQVGMSEEQVAIGFECWSSYDGFDEVNDVIEELRFALERRVPEMTDWTVAKLLQTITTNAVVVQVEDTGDVLRRGTVTVQYHLIRH